MVSSGFILSAYFTYKAETDSIKHFKLNITRNVVIVYYGCGILLIIAAVTGFMAQRKSNKPVLWILVRHIVNSCNTRKRTNKLCYYSQTIYNIFVLISIAF